MDLEAVAKKINELSLIGKRIIKRSENVNKKGIERGNEWASAVLDIMLKYNMASEDIERIDRLSQMMNNLVKEYGEVMVEVADNHLELLQGILEFVELEQEEKNSEIISE